MVGVFNSAGSVYSLSFLTEVDKILNHTIHNKEISNIK